MNMVFKKSETQTFPATLTVINCGECGGIYALNERYRRKKQEVGESWTCPYCKCGWGYSNSSENERLKRELQQEQERTLRERQRHDQTKAELRETERRRRAEKGAKTKLKKRVAHGVCPCCNRTFKQLAAHMSAMHPEYVQEAKQESTP